MLKNKWKTKAVKLEQELKDLRWQICKGQHEWVKIKEEFLNGSGNGDEEMYFTKKCKRCGQVESRRWMDWR